VAFGFGLLVIGGSGSVFPNNKTDNVIAIMFDVTPSQLITIIISLLVQRIDHIVGLNLFYSSVLTNIKQIWYM
jgi:hypothetical protein